MGKVAQAGHKEATFTLKKTSGRTIELTRIDTSCECLTVDLPLRVRPDELAVGRAKLDLRNEPQSMGNVAIEIMGWTSTSEQAFRVVVEVRITSQSEE